MHCKSDESYSLICICSLVCCWLALCSIVHLLSTGLGLRLDSENRRGNYTLIILSLVDEDEWKKYFGCDMWWRFIIQAEKIPSLIKLLVRKLHRQIQPPLQNYVNYMAMLSLCTLIQNNHQNINEYPIGWNVKVV